MASASIAALVMGGALAACGDDDGGSSSSGGVDGGDNETSTPETGTPDTSTPDANKPPPPPPPAKLVLVHAGSDLGESNQTDAVRVCFASAPKATPNAFQVTPFPALPHSPPNDAGTFPFPGIFPGTGGIFPSSGADFEDLVIRPYVMNAETLAARGVVGNAPSVPRCNNLLREGFTPDGGYANDGGPLVKDTDFWQLADIPAGTLKKEKTYMLVVTGCTQDAPATALCGNADNNAPFVPTGNLTKGIGNLKLLVLELDTSAVAADEMGAQVVHASPQYQIYKTGPVPPFTPVLGNVDAGEAGTFPITAGEVEYNRNATTPTALAKVKGLITQTGYLAANRGTADDGDEFLRLALNNTGVPVNPNGISVQALTTGDSSTTQMFVNGKSYTFVLVGHPEGPDAQPNKKVHFLGFPNDFTPPPLQ